MHIEGIKACICEGAAEGAIIDILVDNGLLIFSREEMLDEKVIRSRTGKNFEEQYLRRGFETKVTVLRILDSHHEKFQLSKAYAHQVDVINVVTAPEIEMLIIHAEGAQHGPAGGICRVRQCGQLCCGLPASPLGRVLFEGQA